MFLKQCRDKRTGRVYLLFAQGYRQDGKTKHKTIESLGYLDELQKEYDDPIAHFRQIAKERNEKDSPEKAIAIQLGARLPDQASFRKNLGYVAPKKIYSQLKIREFFQYKQRFINAEFNLNSIFAVLAFNRFLFPSSKKGAFERKDSFFENSDFTLDDVYRSLDYFARYSEELQQHLHRQVCEQAGGRGQMAYYDVTNYYFEIPYEDDDEFDGDGELVKRGFRRRGPSKENRKDPIVQMGLLMDSGGIPMAFNTFSGGESEKTTMLPAIRRVKRDFSLERIVVVADRGLNTSDNTAFLSGKNDDDMRGNDGYVYGQSVLGASAEFKRWVLNPDGYVTSKEKDRHGDTVWFTRKSRIYAKKIQLKDSSGKRGQKMEIYQKQMVYYSEKYARKQKRDREKALSKAMDLIANPGKYTKATSYGATGYINNIRFVKETGEIPDGLELSLNLKKIKEEEQYDGYYSIVTSEKHLSDLEIRDAYKGLWEIEESFKIIKSEFSARPVFVSLPAHIEAHFLICFVALLIMRLLERKLGGKYTVRQIRDSLKNYSCSYLEQNYWLFDYRDDVLREMEDVFGMNLGKKIMSLSEIKNILKHEK